MIDVLIRTAQYSKHHMTWKDPSLVPGMSDKEGSSGEEIDGIDGIWDYDSVLRCGICQQHFRKPRILPCGHTFCEECLIQLRDKTAREWRVKFPLSNKRGDGGTLHCQTPGCQYSMKLMNLTRWAPRNRLAAEALKIYKRNAFPHTVIINVLILSFWRLIVGCGG